MVIATTESATLLEWNHLRTLLALKQGGSIAAAARALAVDHSTVSRQLAALEASLGAQILIRGRKGLVWTAHGTRLLEAATAMDAVATDAVRHARDMLADPTGVVRLSVPTGFLPLLMRLFVPRLTAQHPMIRVEFDGTYKQVDLGSGAADIAIRMSRPREQDLIARRAFSEAWFAYGSESYVARCGRPADREALTNHDLILFAESLHDLEPLAWMEPFAVRKAAAIRVDSIEAALQIALAGGGVTVLPAFVAHDKPTLVQMLPESVALKQGWLVFHEALRHSTRVRTVSRVLTQVFQDNKAIFQGDVRPPV